MNIKDKSEYKNILDTLSYFFIIVFLVRFAGEISIGNDYNFDISKMNEWQIIIDSRISTPVHKTKTKKK